MDKIRNGKTVQNRHFQYKRPYNPRHFHYYNFKRGFWNGLVHFISYLNVSLRSNDFIEALP